MHIRSMRKLHLKFASETRVMPDGTLAPAWYFEHGGMAITDLYVSECGRFQVDPTATYGIFPQQAEELRALNNPEYPQ